MPMPEATVSPDPIDGQTAQANGEADRGGEWVTIDQIHRERDRHDDEHDRSNGVPRCAIWPWNVWTSPPDHQDSSNGQQEKRPDAKDEGLRELTETAEEHIEDGQARVEDDSNVGRTQTRGQMRHRKKKHPLLSHPEEH